MGDSPFAAGALVCGDMYTGRLKIALRTPSHARGKEILEKGVVCVFAAFLGAKTQ